VTVMKRRTKRRRTTISNQRAYVVAEGGDRACLMPF
jgi:hypothetical protein